MRTTTIHVIGYTIVAAVAFLVGAALIFVIAGGDSVTAAAGSSTSTTTRTITSTATVTDPGTTTHTTTATVTAEPPAPATDIPGDGTFEVGVDVEPGTYISSAPSSGSCYWARLSSSSGSGNIIDNNISQGQSIVTISASDAFFETSRCDGWTKR